MVIQIRLQPTLAQKIIPSLLVQMSMNYYVSLMISVNIEAVVLFYTDLEMGLEKSRWQILSDFYLSSIYRVTGFSAVAGGHGMGFNESHSTGADFGVLILLDRTQTHIFRGPAFWKVSCYFLYFSFFTVYSYCAI